MTSGTLRELVLTGDAVKVRAFFVGMPERERRGFAREAVEEWDHAENGAYVKRRVGRRIRSSSERLR